MAMSYFYDFFFWRQFQKEFSIDAFLDIFNYIFLMETRKNKGWTYKRPQNIRVYSKNIKSEQYFLGTS